MNGITMLLEFLAFYWMLVLELRIWYRIHSGSFLVQNGGLSLLREENIDCDVETAIE